jgi:hypothetical protein
MAWLRKPIKRYGSHPLNDNVVSLEEKELFFEQENGLIWFCRPISLKEFDWIITPFVR